MSDKVDFNRSIIKTKGAFFLTKWLEDTIPNMYVTNSIHSKYMKQKLKLDVMKLRREGDKSTVIVGENNMSLSKLMELAVIDRTKLFSNIQYRQRRF